MTQFLPGSVTGFVLAGGRSSRMGADKALSQFQGKSLISVTLETLDQAGIPAQIAGARSDLAQFAEVIPDAFPNTGPMGGVLSALMVSRSEWNVFLPVDLPCLPAFLLAGLLERAIDSGSPIVCARLEERSERFEPFPVVLHAAVLPHLTKRIESQSTACHFAWQTIPNELGTELDCVAVEILTKNGQYVHPMGITPEFWFQSANTPEDLARFNHLRFS